MIAELQTALVVVVFAGGPHTAARYELMRNRLPGLAAQTVFLTGAEWDERYAANLGTPSVFTDRCRTTIGSCFSLSRRLRRMYPQGARVVVFTSNYHAPRTAWLLRGMLPRGTYELSIDASRDMTWDSVLHTSLSKRLLADEVKSWMYCFPIGLLMRPLPLSALLALAAVLSRLRRHGHRTPCRPANGG